MPYCTAAVAKRRHRQEHAGPGPELTGLATATITTARDLANLRRPGSLSMLVRRVNTLNMFSGQAPVPISARSSRITSGAVCTLKIDVSVGAR
jgi:hypothetical protein